MANGFDDTTRFSATVDHLRLTARLGTGPLCDVFLAEDTVAARTLGAKLIPESVTKHETDSHRLRKSLVPAARLHHPSIVEMRHLHDVWDVDETARQLGITRGRQLLLNDYVPGDNLRTWCEREGAVTFEVLVDLFRQVAAALDTAHDEGVCHGYLGPGDVIVTADGVAHVADIGAAAELRASMSLAGQLPETAESELIWMAPEVSCGTPPRPAADVFSIGALLTAALTGHWDGPLDEVGDIDALTAAQNRALRRCRSQDPAQRPASCEEAINAILVGGSAHPDETPEDRDAAVRENQAPPERPDHSSPGGSVGHGSGIGPAKRQAVAILPDREARSGGAEQPARGSEPPPSPPPAKRTMPSMRSGSWVNIGIGLAVLVLAILVALVAWTRWRHPGEVVDSMPAWHTVDDLSRLSREFATTATLGEPAEDIALRLRVIGQTRRLDIGVEKQTVIARQTEGPGSERIVAEAVLDSPCRSGDDVTVLKSPDEVALFVNGVRILAVAWPLEEVVAARWQAPAERPVPATFRLQKIGPLVFADDFMHGENELGAWEPQSGKWTVHALQNPIRSANAFSFLGQGEEAVAIAGHWFWRDYTVNVAAHPLAGSSFGLTFCRTPNGDAYELFWSAAADGRTPLTLSRIVDGRRSTLAEADLPFVSARWYQLEARQARGRIVVSVDGHVAMDVQDASPLLGGAIGLLSRGGEGTVFDDVDVAPFSQASFDFARHSVREPALLRPLTDGSEAGVSTGFDVGAVLLENARVSATLIGLDQLAAGGAVELVARKTAAGELACRIQRQESSWKAVVLARSAGRETTLADVAAPTPTAETEIRLHAFRNEAWVILDDMMVTHVADVTVQGQGICGIRIPPGGGVSPRLLAVQPERQLPPVANRVETFTHEQSMQNWSSAVLEWNVEYAGDRPAYWHRSDFWQEVSATMDVGALFDVNEPQVLGLALRNPETPKEDQKPDTVSLLYKPDVRQVQLIGLPGEPKTLKLMREKVDALGLERRSGRVLARLNGDVIWNEPLPDRLRALCQVGRYGRGNTEPWAEAVALRADGVKTYAFKKAPSTWLPVTGIWEITNRWQCDPRWSFYSGVKRNGVACNWNKFRHGENVTIEFFAGPKMDQSRGRRYEYAANLNAVICADGKDINSGYSFMFGGWDDRGSQIVRQSEIIGENRRVIIPRESSTHRRWFHVKLRKSGDRLSFWVDGTLVAAKTDPEPLAGDRFGLWTWDNGMMVAQFRVSTDVPLQAMPLSDDDLPVPETPYDR